MKIIISLLIVTIIILLFYYAKHRMEKFYTGPMPYGDLMRDFNIDCGDKYDMCKSWASANECSRNPKFMMKNCPTACGVCALPQKERDRQTERIRKVYHTGFNPCVDQDDTSRCENMKLYGWCDKNNPYMEKNCRKTCGRCKYEFPVSL